ncbi:MAG TPA: hypothetical protein ENN23_02430 [Deltaproteobacteria bacterium]|nr:hypothetical protein [Deltaproteobacteria bacterium]
MSKINNFNVFQFFANFRPKYLDFRAVFHINIGSIFYKIFLSLQESIFFYVKFSDNQVQRCLCAPFFPDN